MPNFDEEAEFHEVHTRGFLRRMLRLHVSTERVRKLFNAEMKRNPAA